MTRRLDALVFFVGLLVIAFAAGVVTTKFQIFPYRLISQAWDALDDWRKNWRHYLEIQSAFALPTERQEGGLIRYDPERSWPGYTFSTLYRDGAFGASLIDMDGNTVHRWDMKLSEIWPDPEHIDSLPPDFDNVIHGSALLEDGDVILDLRGIGTVRLDRCSNLKWRLDRLTHHSVNILDNGEALIPSRHERSEPMQGYAMVKPSPSGYYWDDTVLRVDLETGDVLEEVSMIETLVKSGWTSSLRSGPGSAASVRVDDPLHLNDAEMLPADTADRFPLFDPGDIIVSMRDIQTIAVLDGDDWSVKWKMNGPFVGQHDPDFLPNGNILLYDNRIAATRGGLGWTRIIEIDPVTREIVWQYQGTDEEPFYAEARGMQQQLPNENILVTDPFEGRIFELARNPDGTSDIVWDYVNLVEPGLAGLLTDAERIGLEEGDWLKQPACY